MNLIEKTEANLKALSDDFFEDKITKEQFELRKSFLEPILEKAREKKKDADMKAISKMTREEHMAFEKRMMTEMAGQTTLPQETRGKSPEEIEALVREIKAGVNNNPNKEISEMSREEHKKFDEAVNNFV